MTKLEQEEQEACPIEKKIKALELRIETGDMNIHDALMTAYRIGLDQQQTA
jgi:hypothetical protein